MTNQTYATTHAPRVHSQLSLPRAHPAVKGKPVLKQNFLFYSSPVLWYYALCYLMPVLELYLGALGMQDQIFGFKSELFLPIFFIRGPAPTYSAFSLRGRLLHDGGSQVCDHGALRLGHPPHHLRAGVRVEESEAVVQSNMIVSMAVTIMSIM